MWEDARYGLADALDALLNGREPVQGFRVNEALESAGLSHDVSAKVDLLGVQVSMSDVAYCPADIIVTQVEARGDGQPLPREVTAPLGLPRIMIPGRYNIRGATVTANGRTQVSAVGAKIERVKEPAGF